MKAKAFLFDLNGTMINDMPYHIKAWHKILNDLGAGISMERMKDECYGKNNELLERIFPGNPRARRGRGLQAPADSRPTPPANPSPAPSRHTTRRGCRCRR